VIDTPVAGSTAKRPAGEIKAQGQPEGRDGHGPKPGDARHQVRRPRPGVRQHVLESLPSDQEAAQRKEGNNGLMPKPRQEIESHCGRTRRGKRAIVDQQERADMLKDDGERRAAPQHIQMDEPL
jgi:hypothetical protein